MFFFWWCVFPRDGDFFLLANSYFGPGVEEAASRADDFLLWLVSLQRPLPTEGHGVFPWGHPGASVETELSLGTS